MAPAAALNPTPPGDDTSNTNYASYVPHDLHYSEEFETSLIGVVLRRENIGHPGLRIIAEDSEEAPVPDVSTRADDGLLQILPVIKEDALPLPLTDPRRIFTSPIPGVRLTHPNGYLEGGPGLDPEMDTFPEDFLSNNPNIRTNADLERAKRRDIIESMEQLKERLSARQKAIENNERIARELKALTDQHDMELMIQKRMIEEKKAKREAKERQRKEKGG